MERAEQRGVTLVGVIFAVAFGFFTAKEFGASHEWFNQVRLIGALMLVIVWARLPISLRRPFISVAPGSSPYTGSDAVVMLVGGLLFFIGAVSSIVSKHF